MFLLYQSVQQFLKSQMNLRFLLYHVYHLYQKKLRFLS
jgi:hypothetical protein